MGGCQSYPSATEADSKTLQPSDISSEKLTLAHIYWSHYRETLALGLHPHLNTLFTHLTLFCRQHALLEPEDTEPLQDLIAALGQHG